MLNGPWWTLEKRNKKWRGLGVFLVFNGSSSAGLSLEAVLQLLSIRGVLKWVYPLQTQWTSSHSTHKCTHNTMFHIQIQRTNTSMTKTRKGKVVCESCPKLRTTFHSFCLLPCHNFIIMFIFQMICARNWLVVSSKKKWHHGGQVNEHQTEGQC